MQILSGQPQISKAFQKLFSISRTFFSHSRSEQFWKQNTVSKYNSMLRHSFRRMKTVWWLLFIWPIIIPIFAKEIQWKTQAKNSTGKSLYKPYFKGPHFLFWILWVVPFNTWLILSWEESKYYYKLSKCTKWHLYHSKGSKLSKFNTENEDHN